MVDRPASKLLVPPLRGHLWKGALGGALGMLALIGYVAYRDPYTLVAGPSLLLLLLIGGANGMLLGGLLHVCDRVGHSRVGAIFRILFSTIITSALLAIYFYLHEGIGDDPKRFLLNCLLLGLLLGGLAGATSSAGSRSRDLRTTS